MESRSERRLVTCVFIDVVGSTDLTRRLGAERVQRTLSEAFSELSRIAAAEGGTVEKYIGDEVFVLFGAPIAHSDDVLRSLRAAEASARWATSRSEIALRIGIETGEALVDLEALDQRQRMAVGTCVNVAARLQAHAGAGEILVGPVCRAAAASFADFVDLGPLELKGLGEVRAARLAGLVDTEVLTLPFVGRQAELARLRAQFERTKSGRSTLALISGESGIGKSRLADEFTRSAEIDAKIVRTRFRPGTELGRSPLSELVAGPPAGALPARGAPSAGPLSRPRPGPLALVDRRNEIFVSWRDYLAAIARARPLVIVLDDIQWAESEFVRLVDRLTFGSDTPLMVLATARPEFPAMTALRPGEDHLVLELGRLDEEAAGELARVAG